MDEYDLCNQPKREARREVVKKDLCEKGYKKRTQQNKNFVAFKEDLCYNKGTQRADTIRQA